MEVIERRYEYYSPKGKEWTHWFTYKRLPSGSDGKAVLSECKKIPECFKKLKGEYRLTVVGE